MNTPIALILLSATLANTEADQGLYSLLEGSQELCNHGKVEPIARNK